MARLKIGDNMPDFTFDTAYTEGESFSEVIKGKKCALIFLRYYGCPMCQFDIHDYQVNYDRLIEKGILLFVVLQSSKELIKEALKGSDTLSFPIILDPEMKLYKEFEINPAASEKDFIGESTMKKIERVQSAGYEHGEYEGEELQLPASFVIDESGNLVNVLYGKLLDEILDTDSILESF